MSAFAGLRGGGGGGVGCILWMYCDISWLESRPARLFITDEAKRSAL